MPTTKSVSPCRGCEIYHCLQKLRQFIYYKMIKFECVSIAFRIRYTASQAGVDSHQALPRTFYHTIQTSETPMKTLFLSALSLAGLACAANTVFTTTNSAGTSASGWWCNGIYVNLDPTLTNSRVNTASSDSAVSFADSTQVALDSVTLTTREMRLDPQAGGSVSSISLALTDSLGTVVALSNNYADTAGTFTWNFSDTVVNTRETLYFVFVNNDTTNNVTTGYTLTADDMAAPGLGSGGVWDCGDNNTLDKTTLGFVGGNNAKSMQLNTGTGDTNKYAPTVSIKTHRLIPEPATATLSLLALAGLAARRRRK